MNARLNARSGKTTVAVALVVAIFALGIAGLAIYQKQVAPLHAGVIEQDSRYQQLAGVDSPQATNSLDPRYTDADGDLIADVPTDAAKLTDPATLTFSYLALDDDSAFRDGFKELMAAISAATGKPVEYKSFNSTDDQLHALRDGKLTIAGLNTGSVPIGVCTAGFVPICQLGDDTGAAGYHMEIIAPAGSPLNKLIDLRGHTLTLTEPNSNSGYKAPIVILRENGLRPPADYQINFSQGHPQSIEGIHKKSYEAAAVAGDVLKREENLGHISASDFKTIYSSDELFPGAALGVGCQLKPELAAKIKGVLTTFDWKGSGLEKVFAAEGRTKFVPADYKKQWAFVRRIDESVNFRYQLKDATTQPTTQASVLPPPTPLTPPDQALREANAAMVQADEALERLKRVLVDLQHQPTAASMPPIKSGPLPRSGDVFLIPTN